MLAALVFIAATAATPEALFRSLYANVDQKNLVRHSSASLAALIKADEDCSMRTGDVGNLDFVAVLDAQDFDDKNGVAVQKITPLADNKYDVTVLLFPKDPASARHLRYTLVRTKSQWRVDDIEYLDEKPAESLRHILSQPCE